jgi:hypothetical protein
LIALTAASQTDEIFDDRRIVLVLSVVALAKPTPIERPRLALVNADTDMGPVGAMQENIGSVGAIREREYFAAPQSPLNDFTCQLEPVLFDKIRFAQSRAVNPAEEGRAYVRFGSLADISLCKRHVRFTPESGHVRCNSGCLLWAISGHQPPLIACWLMRPVSGTKRSKRVARCLTGNLHQAGKRLTHFQDQKNCTGYR